LAKPGDATALASAILELADNHQERAAMGGRARTAAADFSRERQVARHAEILRGLAGA
jgi:glycosyltransferase involved in cell wall biosynthesis